MSGSERTPEQTPIQGMTVALKVIFGGMQHLREATNAAVTQGLDDEARAVAQRALIELPRELQKLQDDIQEIFARQQR